jgi:hypothetical protein
MKTKISETESYLRRKRDTPIVKTFSWDGLTAMGVVIARIKSEYGDVSCQKR